MMHAQGYVRDRLVCALQDPRRASRPPRRSSPRPSHPALAQTRRAPRLPAARPTAAYSAAHNRARARATHAKGRKARLWQHGKRQVVPRAAAPPVVRQRQRWSRAERAAARLGCRVGCGRAQAAVERADAIDAAAAESCSATAGWDVADHGRMGIDRCPSVAVRTAPAHKQTDTRTTNEQTCARHTPTHAHARTHARTHAHRHAHGARACERACACHSACARDLSTSRLTFCSICADAGGSPASSGNSCGGGDGAPATTCVAGLSFGARAAAGAAGDESAGRMMAAWLGLAGGEKTAGSDSQFRHAAWPVPLLRLSVPLLR